MLAQFAIGFDATGAMGYVFLAFAPFVAPVYSLITGLLLHGSSQPYFGRHAKNPRKSPSRLLFMGIALAGFGAGTVGLTLGVNVVHFFRASDNVFSACLAAIIGFVVCCVVQSILLKKLLHTNLVDAFGLQSFVMSGWAILLAMALAGVLGQG